MVTFAATAAAIAMETYCREHDVPGRLIPVPADISAECGMCWRAPLEERLRIERAVQEAQLADAFIFELEI